MQQHYYVPHGLFQRSTDIILRIDCPQRKYAGFIFLLLNTISPWDLAISMCLVKSVERKQAQFYMPVRVRALYKANLLGQECLLATTYILGFYNLYF